MFGDSFHSLDLVRASLVGCLAIILVLLAYASVYRRKSDRSMLLFRQLFSQQEGQMVNLEQQVQQLTGLEQRLRQIEASRASEVFLFREVTSILGSMQDCEPSLKAAFGRMLEILSFDFGILEIGQKSRPPVRICLGADDPLLETLDAIAKRGWVLEDQADTLSPISFEGYQKSRHFRVLQTAQALVCIPCRVKTKRIGHFLVGLHRPHAYTEEELEGMQFCADQFAASYQMYQQLLDTRELSELRHDYIANVSHELRTPLTTIYGYLNILKSYPAQLFQEEEKQQMFDVMTDECQRLIRLINNLLLSVKIEQEDFSGSTSLKSISLADVINQTCRFMDRELKTKGVTVKIDIPSGLAAIEGNVDLLYQVFQNLIANSIKFSTKDPNIEIVAREKLDRVTIQLSDNGVGIEPQAVPRIFQKFYRAESQAAKRPGLGIGLYLVRKLVELHHGDIQVTSELNKGTTFRLTFPKLTAAQPLSQRVSG
jgi:signal transduction histidine kinase